MNGLKKFLTILILLQLSLVLIIPSYNYAYSESMCPSYMDPNSRQCLNYLRDHKQIPIYPQLRKNLRVNNINNYHYKKKLIISTIKYQKQKKLLKH